MVPGMGPRIKLFDTGQCVTAKARALCWRLDRVSAVVLVLSLSSFPAAAQTAPPAPEPVRTVVTVTATPVEKERTTGDVTVVEPAPAANPQSLADLLRAQPSLYVSQPGVRGGLTSISLRGGDTNFTLLMLDGIPVNDITDQLGGAADLSGILPFDVDRVEVVRGPLSAVYGSEAIGGVINVISRIPETPYVRLRLAGGNFGTFEGRLTAGGQSGRFQYSAGIGGTRIGQQVERDSYDAIDSGARLRWRFTDHDSLAGTVRLRRLDSAGFPASSGGPLYALNRAIETRAAASGIGGLEWQRTAGRYVHRAAFDLFQQAQDQNTPAVLDRIPPSFRTVPATVSDSDFRRSRINGSSSARLRGGWVATVGGSYRREHGENVGSIQQLGPANFTLTRNTGAVFGEAVRDGQWWSLAAGLRSDWATGGVQRTTPRIGASALIPHTRTRVRSSWGKGFKLPSFYALGQPLVGNPNLRPETSESADVSAEQPTALGVLRVNFFHASYRGLVDFSPEQFRLVNRSEAVAKGVDFQWTLLARRRIMLRAHANYVSAYLKNSTELLRERPRWRTGLNASGRWAGFDLYTEGLWVAARNDFQLPVPTLTRAGSYFVANLAAQRRISNRVSAFARLDNILNRKYYEYIGFVNPGIQVRAGLDIVIR